MRRHIPIVLPFGLVHTGEKHDTDKENEVALW